MTLEHVLPQLLRHQLTVSEAAAQTKLSKRAIYKALRAAQNQDKRALAQQKRALLAQLQRVELALCEGS